MIYTITGPSGSGKTALVHCLVTLYPDRFCHAITTTTRPPRIHERDGYDYDFEPRPVDFEEFQRRHLAAVEFDGNFYGISWYAFYNMTFTRRDVLVILEPSGAAEVRRMFPTKSRNIYIKIKKRTAHSRLWHRWKADCKKREAADKAAGLYDADRIPYDCILKNDGSLDELAERFCSFANQT